METTPFTACRWDTFASECPSKQVLAPVADKWTMLVIAALAEADVLRFSQLGRRVQGVSQKMLTQTLRGLGRDGRVSRTVYPAVPATVEYRLTQPAPPGGAARPVTRTPTAQITDARTLT